MNIRDLRDLTRNIRESIHNYCGVRAYKYINNRLIISYFMKYIKYVNLDDGGFKLKLIYEDKKIKINKETHIDYKIRIKVLKLQLSQKFFEPNGDEELILCEDISQLIIKHFDKYILNKSSVGTHEDQNEGDSEVEHLIPIIDFIKNNNLTETHREVFHYLEEKNYDKYYVIDNLEGEYGILRYESILSLFESNRYAKIVMNPFTKKKKKLCTSKLFVPQRVDIEIKDKIQLSIKTHRNYLVTKYSAKCSCGVNIELFPHELNTKVKHLCNADDKSRPVTINEKAIKPLNYINLQMYETKTINDKFNDELYVLSNNFNLEAGKYTVDLYPVIIDDNVVSYLILGYEKQRIEIMDELIQPSLAEKWCAQNNLPHIKLLDILFSISLLYYTYTKRKITQKGMLLQVVMVISALAKMIFNFDKIAINVVGNKSLSKTYISTLICQTLDKDFEHIGTSSNVSIAGLSGGVNTGKIINGQIARVFEEGLFTKSGLTVFDEGQKFFTDISLNESLKNLFDRFIRLAKIGANQKIKQNYTPILFSNFRPEYHEEVYHQEILDTYFRYVRKSNEEFTHDKNKDGAIKYLTEIDLYLPLSYYVNKLNNKTLAKSISYVRDKLKHSGIDWKTGGSLPSSDRFAFDVVCNNKNEGKIKINKGGVIIPDREKVPYEEYIEATKRHLNPDDLEIDLYDLDENTNEVNKQIEILEDDINRFFLEEESGREIYAHLANSYKENVDDKVISVIRTFIVVMQLIEDMTSTKLSENIKVWARLLLLKNKRGITQDEYDFKDHSYTFEDYGFNYTDINVTMSNLKDEYNAEILKRKQEEEFNKKHGIGAKEDDDNQGDLVEK